MKPIKIKSEIKSTNQMRTAASGSSTGQFVIYTSSQNESNIKKILKECAIVLKVTNDDTLTNMIIVIIRATS